MFAMAGPESKTLQELRMLSPSLFIQESQCNCYRIQVYLGSDLWVRVSLTPRGCADLTDVTLADGDTNPILADNANGAFQRNVAKQVTQAGGKIFN